MNLRLLLSSTATLGLLGSCNLSMPTPTPTPPPPPPPPIVGKPSWSQVNSWAIQLGNMGDNLDGVAASSVHLGVINARNDSGYPWTASEVVAAKSKKWLFAYLSVGEAATHEAYWKSGWKLNDPSTLPSWMAGLDVNGHDARMVYPLDHPEWVEIVKERLDSIIAQGFDGAYFDVLDVYWSNGYPEGPSVANQQRAIRFACALSQYTKAKQPGFKIFVNNASNLVEDFPGAGYANCVDATLGESVWYSSIENPKASGYTNFQIGKLTAQKNAGVKIFTLDKVFTPSLIDFVHTESRKHGFIPFGSAYMDFFPSAPQR